MKQFNAFFKDNFDYGTGGSDAAVWDNSFRIEFTGGANFALNDANGRELASGEIKDGKVEVNGMTFTLPDGYEPNNGDFIMFHLEQPSQGNILNKLTEIVNKLSLPQDEWDKQTPKQSMSSLTHDLAEMQQNIELAKKQVDTYRGMVGARGANIDAIIQSDESLTDIKKEAKANVSEMDAFEAVSNLLVAQNALQVAQQSYNLVHSTTLFDYMR